MKRLPIAIALIVSLGVQLAVYYASEGQNGVSDLFSSVIQAPIVEESAKGFVLFLIEYFRGSQNRPSGTGRGESTLGKDA